MCLPASYLRIGAVRVFERGCARARSRWSRAPSRSREIRFFSIVALFAAFYAFGRYTPAFHVMYELMPGVKLFRRPADATFVLGAVIAIIAGYALHRWLIEQPASARQRNAALATLAAVTAAAGWLAVTVGVAAAPVASSTGPALLLM